MVDKRGSGRKVKFFSLSQGVAFRKCYFSRHFQSSIKPKAYGDAIAFPQNFPKNLSNTICIYPKAHWESRTKRTVVVFSGQWRCLYGPGRAIDLGLIESKKICSAPFFKSAWAVLHLGRWPSGHRQARHWICGERVNELPNRRGSFVISGRARVDFLPLGPDLALTNATPLAAHINTGETGWIDTFSAGSEGQD